MKNKFVQLFTNQVWEWFNKIFVQIKRSCSCTPEFCNFKMGAIKWLFNFVSSNFDLKLYL